MDRQTHYMTCSSQVIYATDIRADRHTRVSYRGGGGSPGISPQNDFSPPPTPPRIFTIKIYINEISYVIHYSNEKKEQYREEHVEAIANSKMINSNKL